MRLQSAIFDMDGTLLDSMFIWNDLGARTLRTLGIEPEANLGEKLKVLTVRQGAAYCKDAYHMTQSVDEIVALIEAQVEDFYTHQVQAKAGVVKFLSLLKMEGVWMYVATATDRHLAEAAEVFDEVEASPVMQDLWVAYQKKFSYASDLGWDTVMAAVRQLFARCEGTV